MIALTLMILCFCAIGILGLSMVINVINLSYDKDFINKNLNKNLNKNEEKQKSNLYQ